MKDSRCTIPDEQPGNVVTCSCCKLVRFQGIQ